MRSSPFDPCHVSEQDRRPSGLARPGAVAGGGQLALQRVCKPNDVFAAGQIHATCQFVAYQTSLHRREETKTKDQPLIFVGSLRALQRFTRAGHLSEMTAFIAHCLSFAAKTDAAILVDAPAGSKCFVHSWLDPMTFTHLTHRQPIPKAPLLSSQRCHCVPYVGLAGPSGALNAETCLTVQESTRNGIGRMVTKRRVAPLGQMALRATVTMRLRLILPSLNSSLSPKRNKRRMAAQNRNELPSLKPLSSRPRPKSLGRTRGWMTLKPKAKPTPLSWRFASAPKHSPSKFCATNWVGNRCGLGRGSRVPVTFRCAPTALPTGRLSFKSAHSSSPTSRWKKR
eukprot:m.258077 g.258077  ORF g.258077 m.258077 type:complete len:340 (-) comp19185_c0_seq23:339-1358(-)